MKYAPLFKSMLVLTTVGFTMSLAIPTQAADLVQVYNDAFNNDDAFKSAEYTYLEQKEALPLAYSQLLPQVSGSYSYSSSSAKSYYANIPSYPASFTIGQSGSWGLSASQVVFDWSDFTNITTAKATVASAYASYLSTRQSLIQTTVSNYLAIVQAIQLLNYDLQYQSILKEIDSIVKKSTQGSKSSNGSSPYKKDLDQVQTQYNQQNLQIINDLKSISTNVQSLRTITHHYYKQFNTTHKLSTVSALPPYTSKGWVELSKKHNLTIVSNQASVLSAQATLSTERGARLPTVSLSSSYSSGTGTTPGSPLSTTKSISKSVGLSISMPIFSGGSMSMNTTEARYALESAQATLDASIQSAVSTTKNDYTTTALARASYDESMKTLLSAEKAYNQTKNDYIKGNVNIYNLLSDLSTMMSAKDTMFQNLISYLNDVVTMKYDAGVLQDKDIHDLNALLTDQTHLPKQLQKIYASITKEDE